MSARTRTPSIPSRHAPRRTPGGFLRLGALRRGGGGHALLVGLLFGVAACAGTPEPTGEIDAQPSEDAETRVRIVNSVEMSMRVYAETETQSVYVGDVRPLGRDTFRVPRAVTQRQGRIRFRAEPVGARGRYISDWLNYSEGDEIEWQIFGRPR